MEKYEICKLMPEKEENIVDVVTEEIPLTIYANEQEIVTLLASPEDLEDLAVGFLFSSALIKEYNAIKNVTIDNQRWTIYLSLNNEIDPQIIFRRMFTSGCGRGTLFYNAADILHKNKERQKLTVERNMIFALMKDFQSRSEKFQKTGGVHSAALADKEKILVIREDIGRHNAIDKILGYALKEHIDLNDKIILSSGRISSEILLKTQKTLIPMVVSRSAPTNQAVKHARGAGLTLIGFVRGLRMNVYSGRERIT